MNRLVGGYVNQLPERVKERSPIYQFTPERVKIPVLLFQGEQDIDTPVAQAQELQRAIESQVWKQPVTLKIIAGEGHDLSKNAQIQYLREFIKFFIRYLKPWNLVDNPSVSQSLY